MKRFLATALAVVFCVSVPSNVLAMDTLSSETVYPEAMTSEEIEEFLETAEPLPIPEESNENLRTSDFHDGSYVYDMETGLSEYKAFDFQSSGVEERSSEGFFPANTSMNAESIIEPYSSGSNKVSNTTGELYRSTAKLLIFGRNGKNYVGSGFMIGPNSVATSGHCVYDSDLGGWAKEITVIPALNGTSQPYGSAKSYKLECGGNWASSYDKQDDWGVIRIKSNLGNSTGWLGLKYQSASYNGALVRALGYPGTPETDGTHMYYMWGNVTSCSARTIAGDWDLIGGQSGGPVQYYSNGYKIIGINRGVGSNYSACLRIDEWIYNKLMSYRSLKY